MVLRNPSLLNKRPATLAAKAAALRALPGLRREQAAAAMASLPSLLNLDSQKLRDRWQRLQQVGAPARALAAEQFVLHGGSAGLTWQPCVLLQGQPAAAWGSP